MSEPTPWPELPAERPGSAEPSDDELAHRGDPHVGVAYAVSVRSDQDPRNASTKQTVLTFRLRRLAEDGQLLPPVAVELRGAVLSGMVTDGDLVRLPDPVPHGGALQLSSVANLTTGAEVVARGPAPTRTAALLIIIAAAAVLVLAGFVLLLTL